MNAERPSVLEYPEYREICDDIWQKMSSWESFIITIDGRDNSGKSSLGRYLSWQLGMSCLELDTFRNLQLSPYDFRLDDLRRSIDSRLKRDRPVIVEGVTVRKILRELGHSPSYSVFIRYDNDELPEIDLVLNRYYSEYDPEKYANYVYDRGLENLA